MFKFAFKAVNLLLAILVSSHTFGHQQKEAYTTILFNERSGNLEVSHRFLLHDAEHALSKKLNSESDIVLNRKTQETFSKYLQDNFSLMDQNKQVLGLKEVGFEVEGKFIWVYQEMAIPSALTALSVKMKALQEIWRDQVNHINVEIKGKTLSLRLNSDDEWETLLLVEN